MASAKRRRIETERAGGDPGASSSAAVLVGDVDRMEDVDGMDADQNGGEEVAADRLGPSTGPQVVTPLNPLKP